MNKFLNFGFGLTLVIGLFGFLVGQDFTKHPWMVQTIGFANGLRYWLLATADDQVHLGSSGWLFLNQELKLPAEPIRNLETRASAVLSVAKILQARGTELIVVVVPNKSRIYQDQLGFALPKILQHGYSRWVQILGANQIKTVQLEVVFSKAAQQQQVFLKTDTHWNTAGAAIAARAVAQQIKTNNLTRASFVTRSHAAQPYLGDLIHLMGVAQLPPPFRPESELEISTSTKSLAVANQGLLAAPQSQVVLVGTSYSLRSNFGGALEQALGVRVANLAQEGSGFERSIRTFLQDRVLQDHPPKILIWEFAERFLYLPVEDSLSLP